MTTAVLLTILVGVIVCLAEIALDRKTRRRKSIVAERNTNRVAVRAGHFGGYFLNIR